MSNNPLPKVGSPCKLMPTDEFIAADVNNDGWIPLEKIYIKERIGKGGIQLRREEIPFIHPKDLCILRIKHQMAQDGITGAAREGIIRLYTNAVEEIDLLFPEIINPNGGGYSSRYLTAYKSYPDFHGPAAKHRAALEMMNNILKGNNYPHIWIGNIPFTKPDGNSFGKNDIRETLAEHTKIKPEQIVLVKLAPPTIFNGVHGGKGTLFLTDEATSDHLLSFDGKITVLSKTQDGIKELKLSLRAPLEESRKKEEAKINPPKSDSMW